VVRPRDLKISTSNEKAGVDLFVNGRLREKDILKHMPDFSTRFVSSYLYGQIHFNDLDDETTDKVFTSSREGVVEDNEEYKNLLDIIQGEILEHISDKWDEWRIKHKLGGDEDNPRKGKKERHARGLFNETANEYKKTGDGDMNGDISSLIEEAEFNLPAYTACFLSENLLRKHIFDAGAPDDCSNIDPKKLNCQKRNPDDHLKWCEHCRAIRGMEVFQDHKKQAGTSIQVRVQEDDVLQFMDFNDLAQFIGESIIKDEHKSYRPLRNSVMHTSLLTREAKTKLQTILDNIAATIKSLGKDE